MEDPFIANNTIVDNTMTSTSDGSECTDISQIYPGPYAYGYSGPSAVIINNIISGSTPYPAVNCSWFFPPSESIQPTFENNILYNAGGPFFGSYCVDVSGKYNNVVADPQFVDPLASDYRLKSTSPAIDTGQNSVLQTLLTKSGSIVSADFDGNPRVQNVTGRGCIIDMGAFEYPGTQSSCSTAETLVSSLNPSSFGQSVTFSVQLSSATGVPAGSVQFSDGNTVLANVPVSGAGVSTFSTSQLTIGNHTITAAYQPTGSFAASTASLVQVVNGYATTTALNCSPASIPVYGGAQLSAVVTSANGTPTGSITFADQGTPLATQVLSAGATNLSYTGLVAGAHTLTATYIPSGAFAVSSASCSESVTLLPSASVLSVTPASSTYGSPVTLKATVSPLNAPGPSTPAGAVTFYNGNSAIGTAPLGNGAASLVLSTLPGGNANLSCVYTGSSVYSSSSCNTILFPVNAAASTLTLSSSASPSPALSPVTFTARLSANGQPAGGNLIALSVNGQTISLTTDVSGLAQYTINSLLPGTYPVTANFAAIPSLQASSASLVEVVSPALTGTSISVNPQPAYVGQVVTIAATVTPQAGSAQPVAGYVAFFDGPSSLGKQPLNGLGTATFTTSTLAVGTHPISAKFISANNVFVTSTSAIVDEQIVASGFTIGLSPISITLQEGASATAAIQLASIGNFAGPLALTYGNLPANATVSMHSDTVSLTPGGTGSSILTLNTLLKLSKIDAPPPSRKFPVVFAALSLFLVPLGFARRTRLARLLGIVLLVSALQVITGCTNAWYTAGAVAPGTYPLTVTATDINHNSQTATLTVVVTP